MKLSTSSFAAPRIGAFALVLAWFAPLVLADENDHNLYYDPTNSNTPDKGGTGTSSGSVWWTGNARYTWSTGSSGSIATYWNLYFGGAGQTEPYTFTTALTTTTISGTSSDLKTLSLFFQGDYIYTKRTDHTNTSTVGGSGNYGYLAVYVDPGKSLTLTAGTDAAQSNRIAFVGPANNSQNPSILFGGGGTITFAQNTDLNQSNGNGLIRVGEANKATTLNMNAGSTLTAKRIQVANGTVNINGIDATFTGSTSARGNSAIQIGVVGTVEEGYAPATFNLNSGSVVALSGTVRPNANDEDRPYGQGVHGILFAVNPNSSSPTANPSLSGGTFNLNGGTLTTTDIYANPNATEDVTAKFVFNGGKLVVAAEATQEQLDSFITGFKDTANNHVEIAAGGAFIDTGSIDTANTNGTATIASAMRGEGALTKLGSGTLVLAGENTYTGGTVINEGTLAGNVGGGRVTIAQGATYALGGQNQNVAELAGPGRVDLGENALHVGSAANSSFAGTIEGAGSLVKEGSGELTLSGANTYTGNTTVAVGTLRGNISGGALSIEQGATYDLGGADRTVGALSGDGNIVLGAATLTTDSSLDTELGGVISGTGGLVKNGSGTLTLSGNNTYTGTTRVNTGTLQVNTVTMIGNLINDALVIWDQLTAEDDITYGGDISGSGALHKTGAGTLRLLGTNTYTGGTTVTAGTLEGNTDSLQGAFVNNAAVVFDQSFNGTYAGAMSGTGSLTKSGGGTLTLTGANSYLGGTFVNGGTLVGNTSSLQGVISTNATLVFNQTTNGTFNGALSGSGSIQKLGAGTLTLEGQHGFTGTTFVNAGALRLNAYLAGSLEVANQARVSGVGYIAGNTTINGTHAPGDPIGIQEFGGNLTYGNGARVELDLLSLQVPVLNLADAAPILGFDQILVNGDLTFAGAVSLALSFNGAGSIIDWTDPIWGEDQMWIVFAAFGEITGVENVTIANASWLDSNGVALRSVYGGAHFTLEVTEDGNAVALMYHSAIPEPSTYAVIFGALALGFVAWCRRRG